MIRAAAPSQLGREFDDFLFSPIGEERNGSTLSVVSALARSDVDPWHEAAKLARLPRAAATERLASMIGALPDATSFDNGTIAARLIALLPRSTGSAVASQKQLVTGAATPIPTARSIVTYAILWVVFMAVQSITMGHQPPPQAGSAVAPTPHAITTQTGTLPTGK